MIHEQKNLCREFMRAVLLHAKIDGFGWRSTFTLTFTEDERREMEKIINNDPTMSL